MGSRSDATKLNVISHEGLSCSLSVARDTIAERLFRLCGRSKCIIIIRNQLEAIVSMYSQAAQNPTRQLLPFDDFLAQGIRAARFLEFRHYYYDEFISIYESVFGQENILVLPYETLRTSPEHFVATISSFADIDMMPPALTAQVANPRVSDRYIKMRRAAGYLMSGETMRNVWLNIPVSVRNGIKKIAYGGKRYEIELTKAQTDAITAVFGPSNVKLNSRRNLKLDELGYPL